MSGESFFFFFFFFRDCQSLRAAVGAIHQTTPRDSTHETPQIQTLPHLTSPSRRRRHTPPLTTTSRRSSTGRRSANAGARRKQKRTERTNLRRRIQCECLRLRPVRLPGTTARRGAGRAGRPSDVRLVAIVTMNTMTTMMLSMTITLLVACDSAIVLLRSARVAVAARTIPMTPIPMTTTTTMTTTTMTTMMMMMMMTMMMMMMTTM
jgi:hypothetical protein